MLFKVRILAAHDAGDDIAHAVVVADLLMLVPRRVLARLRGPLAGMVRVLERVGQKAAARGAGDDLVAVVGNGGVVAEAAALLSVHGRAHGLGGVLHEKCAVGLADPLDDVHPRREAVQVRHDYEFHVRIKRKRLFQRGRVHIPATGLGVDKDGDTALIDDRVERRVKGHVRAEHALPLQRAVADGGAAVEPLPRQLDAQMQCGGAGGQADGVFHARLFGGDALDLVDVLAHGAHPVGVVGMPDIRQLLAVHGGGGEKRLLREGLKRDLIRKKHKGTSFFLY